MRETEPSLMVNWYEVEIFDTIKNKVIYKNSFITNHELKEQNIFPMIVSGRTRWKVENESNNILKNQGYNLEHNFGHGQENLSEILLSLNLPLYRTKKRKNACKDKQEKGLIKSNDTPIKPYESD